MAEPEDLISDAARHATIHGRALWRRVRPAHTGPPPVTLADVAQRIDLLLTAVFGRHFAIRTAQPGAPTTFLTKVFRRGHLPRQLRAVPATDGAAIWLPGRPAIADAQLAVGCLRTMALQQAMRAQRGSAGHIADASTPLVRDLYLLLEAAAADTALATELPGTGRAIDALRQAALRQRPPLREFAAPRRTLEQFVRAMLAGRHDAAHPDLPHCATPADALVAAERLAGRLAPDSATARALGPAPLFRDLWTGDLRCPSVEPGLVPGASSDPSVQHEGEAARPRSARLERRPEVREARDDEDADRAEPGAWMVQLDQPHEHAEDPFGLQRPADRDEDTSADDYADSVAELAEARLVSSPGRPKEVLLSDDPPEARAKRRTELAAATDASIAYPEWDYRIDAYRDPGAIVQLLAPQTGPQQWVERTLGQHRSMLDAIRRRFQLLRARRATLRRQLDGDDLDLDACVESLADFRAGRPLSQALYRTSRPARRDMAILLLADVSGSTDGWVADNRRVIDVEREALLLVCLALDGLGEPYAVQAFSGEGPAAVTLCAVKRFDEPYGNTIAQRIAALEPEHYTRVGAAIRHSSALLMQQPAAHRLLLLLSDGKPNDVDDYEGRYGVEDMRQAVTEAKLQGIFPFCLTIDRQAAAYLPAVFGTGHYALLPRPELLPAVLLDWMRRLVAA